MQDSRFQLYEEIVSSDKQRISTRSSGECDRFSILVKVFSDRLQE